MCAATTGNLPHSHHGIRFPAVDDMRRSKFSGKLEARWHHIGGNNGCRSRDPRRHYRTQPHRTPAEGGETAAWSDFQCVLHGACAGLNAAAQRAKQLEWRFLRHLDHVTFIRKRICAECRLSEEMIVNGSTVVMGFLSFMLSHGFKS